MAGGYNRRRLRRDLVWLRRTVAEWGSQLGRGLGILPAVPGRCFVTSIRLILAALALAFLRSAAVAQQAAPDQPPPAASVPPAPPPFPNFGAAPSTRHHGAVSASRHVTTAHRSAVHKRHSEPSHRAAKNKKHRSSELRRGSRRHRVEKLVSRHHGKRARSTETRHTSKRDLQKARKHEARFNPR